MSPAPAAMPPVPLSAHTAVHGPITTGPAHHLAESSGQDYTVRPGDTVYDIAAKYDTTAAAIARANDLADGGRWIMPGQRLRLGTESTQQTTTESTSKTSRRTSSARSSSTPKTVTVRPGSTLSGIAAKHGVSVQSLASANNIHNTRLIYPGQRLVISKGSTSSKQTSTSRKASSTSSSRTSTANAQPKTVSVRSGDTLSGIAAKYGISLAALQRANPDIEPRALWVGSTVRLSGTSSRSTASTKESSAPKSTPTSQAPRSSPYTPDNIGNRYTGSDVDNTFLHYTYSSPVARSAAANRDYLAGASAPSRDATKAMIVATARRHGVDPSLMLALSYQESGWNQRAVSPANAIGAMQVIPTSGDWASGLVGRQLNLLDPQDNVTAGTVIMRALLRSSDTEAKAIGGYYQGMGSVQQYGLFNDTKSYVASIKALRATM